MIHNTAPLPYASCGSDHANAPHIHAVLIELCCAAVCEVVLPGPEAAARAAAAAPNKKRSEAEAAIARAVANALHILGSLKQIVSLVSGAPLPT